MQKYVLCATRQQTKPTNNRLDEFKNITKTISPQHPENIADRSPLQRKKRDLKCMHVTTYLLRNIFRSVKHSIQRVYFGNFK